jgi:hypothetical protein
VGKTKTVTHACFLALFYPYPCLTINSEAWPFALWLITHSTLLALGKPLKMSRKQSNFYKQTICLSSRMITGFSIWMYENRSSSVRRLQCSRALKEQTDLPSSATPWLLPQSRTHHPEPGGYQIRQLDKFLAPWPRDRAQQLV